ncbi:MAG: hypothetical protein HQL73_09745, partial [Magnetococcales bacterium]|nr:hypothetical protein [Magnetococcales bacterium]
MRMIDRWLGTLLCFLASLLATVARWIIPSPPMDTEPRRILFIGIAEAGALVLAYPALQWVRRRYPSAELFFLSFTTGRGVLTLMGLDPDSQQIILRPSPWYHLFLDTLRVIVKLWRLRLDATINLEVYTRFSTLLAFLSGAPRRVGFHRFFEEGHYSGRLLTHEVIYNPHHAIGYSYLALARALEEQPQGEPLAKIVLGSEPLERLTVTRTDQDKQRMRLQLQRLYPPLSQRHRLIILNANASDLIPVRRWSADNFAALATRVLTEVGPEVVILLTGAPAERPALERLRMAINDPRVINMAGETSLESLIDL